MTGLFFISLFALFSVWVLYPLILKTVSLFAIKKPLVSDLLQSNPAVSVIIAAHNEEKNLEKRVRNIYEQIYDGKIEIIIASDGSTDDTSQVVSMIAHEFPGIVFIDIQPQAGRSNAHNVAVTHATHDILIFTDADTYFEPSCIKNLVWPFTNSDIGFVSGTLKYRNMDHNDVTESAGLYWRYEMRLRQHESDLGVFATGTGACCAVRKSLYKEIPPTGDVDFITPLDVVISGRRCHHSPRSIAWDDMPGSPVKELKARIRMTSKNLHGTVMRWGFASFIRRPLLSLCIALHKVGRWLTPFFLLMLFLSSIFLAGDSFFYAIIMMFQVGFYLLGALGYLGISVLYSKQIYSFLLINVGFMIGVVKVITGNVPHQYKPVNQQ